MPPPSQVERLFQDNLTRPQLFIALHKCSTERRQDGAEQPRDVGAGRHHRFEQTTGDY